MVDNGTDYQIAVDGANGAAGDVRFRLRLVTLPEIETEPRDVLLTAGESTNFVVEAIGPPLLRYQWQFNGAAIPGAVSNQLVLTNVTEAQAGSYAVSVSNDRGATASRRATLAVRGEPRILQSPGDRLAGDGETVVFTVVAVGRQPLAYQWQFRGLDLPGRTSANLVLDNVQPTDDGSYRVIVANDSGSATSGNAVLTVRGDAPYPRHQPVGVTNVLGSQIALFSEFGGSRPMAFQWFRNPSQLLPGQTSSNLVINSAQLSDAGEYWVRATNSRGETNSHPAAVRVVTPPPNDHYADRLEILLTNAQAVVGGWNFGATAEAGEPDHNAAPPAQSVWWKWSAPARGLATVDLSGSNFRPRLGVYTGVAVGGLKEVPYRSVFDGAKLIWLTDPGIEYAVAVDRRDALPGDIRLGLSFTTNLLPPVILSPPVEKHVQACETLRLQVVATNQPLISYPLSYQWQRDGADLPGATDAIYEVPSAAAMNAGNYSVRVSNFGGLTESRKILCEVKTGPKITLQPFDRTLFLCENTTLQVLAVGCPPIRYQWRFEGVDLPGETNTTLRLENVDVGREGAYSALISNPDGITNTPPARVTINRAPRLLSDNLYNQTVRECSNLTFQVNADGSCRPLTYQWYYNRTNPIPGATTNTLQLVNARTSQAGDYHVVVANLHTNTVSRAARLTVSALPLIPGGQPADKRRVRLGDSFTLEVQPESCTPMTYQWFFNGTTNLAGLTHWVTVTNRAPLSTNVVWATNLLRLTNLVGGVPVVSLNTNVVSKTNVLYATNTVRVPMLAGGTGPVLVFTQPSTNLNGSYQVEVGNAAGTTRSRLATVEILVPPPNDDFQNSIPITGTNVTVTGHDIIATREPGDPSAWERSVWWTWTAPEDAGFLSVDLAGSGYDTLLTLYTNAPLTSLMPIASDDNGGGSLTSRVTDVPITDGTVVYLAVDGKLNAEGPIKLRVVYTIDTNPPVIIKQPQSVAVLPGGTATFELGVARTPCVQFQWQFEGADFRWVDLSGQTKAVLLVTHVAAASEGRYRCVARNKYGATTSSPAALTTGAILKGLVTDATNKRGVPGATVSVGPVFTLTDANGNYELVGARPGTLRADFDADRQVVGMRDPVQFLNYATLNSVVLRGAKTNVYFDYEDRQYVVTAGTTISNSFSMSPILADGMRFVLNWGLNPADLDAHLRTPVIDGQRYEIDYRRLTSADPSLPPFALLDADERRSYGPETVTINRFAPGIYQYFVQKFDPNASGNLPSSQASVRVYDRRGLIRTVDAPTAGQGKFWHVLNVDGATHNVTVVNQITGAMPTPAARPAPIPGKGGGTRASSYALMSPPTGAQYLWDFGDSQTSASAEPQHAYAAPGRYTVSLQVTTRAGGALTNVAETKVDFITVTNDPPRVRITSPAPGQIFRLDALLDIQAEAADSDGRVAKVEFIANGKTIGEALNPPFTLAWTPPAEGAFTLSARATDQHGASGSSPPVAITVRDVSGDILIVRSFPDPEIDLLYRLASDFTCLDRASAFVTRVLDRQGLTFELMSTFSLIIWDDLGSTQQPLSEAEVALFRQAYDAGIAWYFIGDHLAGVTSVMSPAAAAGWTNLVHLAPAGTRVDPPTTLTLASPDLTHMVLQSPYAEFQPFVYGGGLESAVADPTVDVLVRGADTPVLLAYPSAHQDDRITRTLTQNFRVGQSGDDSGRQQERLFRSAIAWLIQCGDCPQSDMQINAFETLANQFTIGEPFDLKLTLRHSGACDPTGVTVTNSLPDGVRLISATPANYLARPGRVSFRLGRLPNGIETNVTLTLVPLVGGSLTVGACVSSNGRDAFPADNCATLELNVGYPAQPRLRISRLPGQVRLDFAGDPARAYALECSTNLLASPANRWREANLPLRTNDGLYFLDATLPPVKAYRVRGP